VVEKPIERLPRQPEVALRPLRLGRGGRGRKALPRHPRQERPGPRRRDRRAPLGLRAGDAVPAAPAVDQGRVYAGSFDKHVYALDAASGKLLWKRDTQGAVVSTPAVAGELLVVGNRAYDVLGLRARTGEVAWKRYVWFSWVESSATVRDGVAYVGSSDAAAVLAIDTASGRRLWAADVLGWAWGQPAVSESRVYAGTSSQAGCLAGHRAGVMALDRGDGRAVWRYEAPGAASGAFGSRARRPGRTRVRVRPRRPAPRLRQ
jgi:outer membrane protein assembly factor BamB